jgi:alcohol dehydrogenase class IV
LNSLTDVIPEQCYAVLVPLVTSTNPPTTRDALQRYQRFAGCAYKAQLYTGRLEEAQTLHQTVQDLLAKQGADKELLDADNTAYTNSLSKDSVTALFVLFQTALDNGDIAAARKWSAILDAFAPEDQNAGKARKMLRALKKK